MKRLYVDQIARAMNTAEKNTYQDVAHATAALKWTVDKIESYLNKCLNVEDGQCNLTWKHEDCKVLMDILYDLTEDVKYKETTWRFDPKQEHLWD
jgi:hypothetical protein